MRSPKHSPASSSQRRISRGRIQNSISEASVSKRSGMGLLGRHACTGKGGAGV